MRALVLCALAMFAPAVWAGEQAADLLRSCVQAVDEDVVGVVKLERACPGIRDALTELDFSSRLQRGWQDDIDSSALGDLLALHERYAQKPATDPPKTDALGNVLRELGREQDAPRISRWERFKNWLRALFKPRSAEAPTWLEKLLDQVSVSASVMRIILYGLIALVIGMAIWVVVNELRAAGLLRRSTSGAKGRIGDGAGSHTTLPVTVAHLDAVPWNERPAILLKLLIGRLVELRRLSAERSLTHRELGRRAQFSVPVDHERFDRLARMAEALRFGPRREQGDAKGEVDAVVTDARALFSKLSAESRA